MIHQGDCSTVIQQLDSNSIHAIITDPPYAINFMGNDWDNFNNKEYQKFFEKWSSEAMRVLKPGGHLLAFSGNRTHHRAFTGIEDAGYEIRDTITWLYGQGFPKGKNVSKAIDSSEESKSGKAGRLP